MGMGLTDDQFSNLLAFVIVLHNEYARNVLDISPDYMVEKFHRYLGDDCVIMASADWRWGLHPKLREVFDEYIEKWCVQ